MIPLPVSSSLTSPLNFFSHLPPLSSPSPHTSFTSLPSPLAGSGRVTPNKTSRYLAIKARTPSFEGPGGSRPRSATAHYQQPSTRRQSGPTKETTPGKSEDSRRGSTPSSGRNTPVMRGVARESTDGGMMSTARSTNPTTTTTSTTGLPPRTPYRCVSGGVATLAHFPPSWVCLSCKKAKC